MPARKLPPLPRTEHTDDHTVQVQLPDGTVFTIDACDWAMASQWRWWVGAGGRITSHAESPYGTTYLHRWVAGATRGDRVEFIDGNHLNLRRTNLRCYSKEQPCNP